MLGQTLEIPHKTKSATILAHQDDDDDNRPITIIAFKEKDKSVVYSLQGHLEDLSLRSVMILMDKQTKDVDQVIENSEGQTWTKRNPYFLAEDFAKKFHKELVDSAQTY